MSERPPHERRPLFRLDPGWLFLLPGLVIIAATVLMPAGDDLARARAYREKALALETYRSQRLANHLTYLDALQQGDETVLLDLAASQLNLAPADREVIIAPAGLTDASVLDRLDATYKAPTVALPPDSLLHRLTTNRHTRLWMIAGGAMCVLYALLPPATRADRKARRGARVAGVRRALLLPLRRGGSPRPTAPTH
jgi:hypothetical protein